MAAVLACRRNKKHPRTSPDSETNQPSRFSRAFQGLSTTPENPSPNPEPANRPETSPDPPYDNQSQQKEACKRHPRCERPRKTPEGKLSAIFGAGGGI